MPDTLCCPVPAPVPRPQVREVQHCVRRHDRVDARHHREGVDPRVDVHPGKPADPASDPNRHCSGRRRPVDTTSHGRHPVDFGGLSAQEVQKRAPVPISQWRPRGGVGVGAWDARKYFSRLRAAPMDMEGHPRGYMGGPGSRILLRGLQKRRGLLWTVALPISLVLVHVDGVD